MLIAVAPGAAPTARYSPMRMPYLPLARTIVVTGSGSRACVESE
jgi:hypothetical protein